ncbi:unnamed protein product [Pylaiella littoralis]
MCGLFKPRFRGITEYLRRSLHDAVMSKGLLSCVRIIWITRRRTGMIGPLHESRQPTPYLAISLQSVCGVSPSGAPTNAALHALFSTASTLGDEAFYTVALPLCAWMLDLELSRRLAFFWASTYYVGQSAKELLKLPRPPAPVIRLEHRYSAEYGLPSTHTMGSLIPLFLVACHHFRYEENGDDVVPETVLLWSCLAWSVAIATSRLYMGVHSIPDVLAGYLLGGCLLAFWLTFGDAIDGFIVGNPKAWLAVLCGAGVSILGYPCPDRWTNSFGDTTIIVATAAGFLEACCLLHQGGGVVVMVVGSRSGYWKVCIWFPLEGPRRTAGPRYAETPGVAAWGSWFCCR